MAANGLEANEYVYRICPAKEWEEFLIQGFSFGEPIDKNLGCINLCMLHQVQQVLLNFFLLVAEDDLYLLQIDTKELGDGLVYEALLIPSPNNPSISEYDIFPCF